MIETFLQWMPGVYNNKLQAYAKPFEFPIVRFNIEFLSHSSNNSYAFRVEQYKPSVSTVPYRVGHFKVTQQSPNSIFLQNYAVEDTDDGLMGFIENDASAYENSNLVLNFNYDKEIFESKIKNYSLIKNDRQLNVQSYLKLNYNSLELIDRAYDASTSKLLWGFDYGAVLLNKERI